MTNREVLDRCHSVERLDRSVIIIRSVNVRYRERGNRDLNREGDALLY